jgi:hypothetical protein
MYKKILIGFLMVFLFSVNSYSLAYNSSYTDLYFESEDWCANIETTFLVYNISQYNVDSFEDDLCRDDEDPDEDNCEVYNDIDANIIIYDGPFDVDDKVLSNRPIVNNEFSYTFTKEGIYLLQVIVESGKFNEIEGKVSIKDCEVKASTVNLSNSNIQTPDLYNNSFEYSASQTSVDIVKGQSNDKNDLAIKLLTDTTSRSLPKLGNLSKILEIDYSDLGSYESIILTTAVATNDSSKLEIYKIVDLNWVKINEYQYANESISISQIDSNYYAIVIKEEQIIEEIVEEPVVEEIVIVTEDPNSQDSGVPIIAIIGVGLISIIVIVILYFLFANNKTKTKAEIYDNYNQEKSTDSKKDKIDNTKTGEEKSEKKGGFLGLFKKKENAEEKKSNEKNNNISNQGLEGKTHQEASEEVLNKTREYVKKYKETYSKDGIRQALKGVNISDDVIDKIFSEEFK